jgi:hypothetical protein
MSTGRSRRRKKCYPRILRRSRLAPPVFPGDLRGLDHLRGIFSESDFGRTNPEIGRNWTEFDPHPHPGGQSDGARLIDPAWDDAGHAWSEAP